MADKFLNRVGALAGKFGAHGVLMIFLFKLSSCTISTTRLDNEQDKANAEKITREFYDQLKSGDYEKTLYFYSDAFKKKIDTNQLFSFYKHYQDKTGVIKNLQVFKCNAKEIDSAGKKIRYFTIIYQVDRSIKRTKESFLLKALGDELPKINRYDIFENEDR